MTMTSCADFTCVSAQDQVRLRLEPELWEALLEIGRREDRDVPALLDWARVTATAERNDEQGAVSAVRSFIVRYFRRPGGGEAWLAPAPMRGRTGELGRRHASRPLAEIFDILRTPSGHRAAAFSPLMADAVRLLGHSVPAAGH